jgi:hypothetical protein
MGSCVDLATAVVGVIHTVDCISVTGVDRTLEVAAVLMISIVPAIGITIYNVNPAGDLIVS